MPTPDTTIPGAPCWVDLMTSDRDRSAAFYGELFGWTVVDPGPEYGGYVNFHKDGVPVAGCMRITPEMETPDVWSVYLRTDDAEKTVETAVANGGQVIVPAMPVLALGSMAMVTDVGGAAVGLWQPGEHAGFGIVAEPDAPGWFELFTRDHAASVAFYREVFGWEPHAVGDTDEFRYTTLLADERAAAGIMDASGFLPEGVPAHWSVYFQVEDTDATLARATQLGGSVVVPAEDTPYGRLATVSDPTGAVFKLVG